MQKQVSFSQGPALETVKGWEWGLGWVTLKELFMKQRSSVSYCSGCGMQNEPHIETAVPCCQHWTAPPATLGLF